MSWARARCKILNDTVAAEDKMARKRHTTDKEEEDDDEVANAERMCIGFFTRFWRHMASHKAFVEACPTLTRLADLALVMVPVSVEDERLFSALKFIKSACATGSKTRTQCCSQTIFSKTFDVETFPYDRALKAWKQAASSRRCYRKAHT
eukprot:364139-Chlamydomonas_euryale.AAC.9